MPQVSAAPDKCDENGCKSEAAIVHRGKPLCGKHALERLEQELAAGNRLPLWNGRFGKR